jgi:hypothetical protein
MATSAIQKYFAGLSRNTFLLAFASLFADISTEMLYAVLPVFLTQTRKSIALAGYLPAAAAKPYGLFFFFSTTVRCHQKAKINILGRNLGFNRIWAACSTRLFRPSQLCEKARHRAPPRPTFEPRSVWGPMGC